MGQQRQHRGGNLHQYEGDQSQRHGDLYYNSQSVAEATLQQYGGGGQNNANRNAGMPTRAGPDGRQYPFNPDDPLYLSKFEVGFRGCFKCGAPDHNRREQCPLRNEPSYEKLQIFYKELKIHKPAFRHRSNTFAQVSIAHQSKILLYMVEHITGTEIKSPPHLCCICLNILLE